MAETLIQLSPTSAISGMALGVDQDFAWVCISLGLPFLAAIPFAGQESNWPHESRDFYHRLLERAYHVTVVSEGGYAAWKMQKRNEWMVNNCQTLIAVWDGSAGGTGNCVRYAKSVGRNMHRINPSEFRQETR